MVEPIASPDAPSGRLQSRFAAVVLCVALFAVYLLTEPPRIGHVPTDFSPNSLVPVALLEHHNFDLRPYDKLLQPRSPGAVAIEANGRLVSFYPVGASVSALPFYLPLWLRGTGVNSLAEAEYAGQLAAAAFTAASAALLLLVFAEWLPLLAATGLALLYGLGTCNFSTLNKALWQHSPAVFWVSLAIYGLTGLRARSPRWLACVGFALGMAVFCRPTNLPFLPAAFALLLWRRDFRAAAWLTAGALPPALMNAWYNIHYLGGLLNFGGYTRVGGNGLPTIERVQAHLFSPARGLLIFLPFLLLLPAAFFFLRRVKPPCDRSLITAFFAGAACSLLLTAGWRGWWGGYSYGPRLLSDLAPALMPALVPLLLAPRWPKVWRALLLATGTAAIGIHALGALMPGRPYYWEAVYMPSDTSVENMWKWRYAPVPFYTKVLWRAHFGLQAPLLEDKDCAGAMDNSLTELQMAPGEVALLSLRLSNLGGKPWWNLAGRIGGGEMHLSYRWLSPDHQIVIPEGGRSMLWDDVPSRTRINAVVRVVAPPTPGNYILRLAPVAEGMRWCDIEGGTYKEIPVSVG